VSDSDDEEDKPVNQLAVARSEKALEALVEAHPELRGPGGEANVASWMAELARHEEASQMAKDKESTTQVTFRLPDSLIKRLDRHVERMNADYPGMTFTRADAVRTLLTSALDDFEGKRGKK
jgi:hypothetical protein